MLDARLFHFIKKEFIQLLRDPRMLFIALMAPVIQLIVFGYIASTDINHISTVILDEDKSYYSRNYLQSYKNPGYFDFNYYVARPQQMADLIDSGRAKLGLRVPVNFGRKIVRGDTASVQAVIDGSNSSTAAIIQGYINQINFGQVEILLRKRIEKAGGSRRSLEPMTVNSRIWYNPDLKSINYMVPAIFAQICPELPGEQSTSTILCPTTRRWSIRLVSSGGRTASKCLKRNWVQYRGSWPQRALDSPLLDLRRHGRRPVLH